MKVAIEPPASVPLGKDLQIELLDIVFDLVRAGFRADALVKIAAACATGDPAKAAQAIDMRGYYPPGAWWSVAYLFGWVKDVPKELLDRVEGWVDKACPLS